MLCFLICVNKSTKLNFIKFKNFVGVLGDFFLILLKMDDLQSINWISLSNSTYILKYLFHDTGYHIMTTNLTCLYSEKLDESSILKRFCELNPFAQMKMQVILENLRKSLEKCLAQEAEPAINLSSNKLILSLEFSAGLVLCKYKFEMNLLEAEKITEYIICPTIFNALLCHKKVLELQKKLIVYESTKSSLTSNVSISNEDPIDPDLFKGKNFSPERLLDSFLKIQNSSKDLFAENLEAYNASKKGKSKNDHSSQSLSANKKIKQENIDGESNSINFQDSDERIVIKKEEEETICSDNLSSQTKTNVKRKKIFKI